MNVINLAVGAALAAALAAATPVAATTNLIANGGFEAGAVPADGQPLLIGSSRGTLSGWDVLGPATSAVALLNTNYTEIGTSRFNAFDGDTALDITGGGNTGPDSGVRQRVNTVDGQIYTLSFWLGNADGSHNGNYNGPSQLRVAVGDGPMQLFTNADETLNSVNWRRVTLNFTAVGRFTDITFLNATPTTGAGRDAYAGLDNVSLSEAVPEPATWTMMIAGFGMAGALLRRRAVPA